MKDAVIYDDDGNVLPDNKCPNCGVELDAATAIDNDRRPKPNDLVVCYRCGAMMKFTDLMILRILTQAEFDEIEDEELRETLLQASEFIMKNNPP